MENNERVIDPSFLEVIKGVCTGEAEELFDVLMQEGYWIEDEMMISLEALWINNPKETKGSVRTLIRTLLDLEAYNFYYGDGDFGNVLDLWIKYPVDK